METEHLTSARKLALRVQSLKIRQLPPTERSFSLEHRLPYHGVYDVGQHDPTFTAVWPVDREMALAKPCDLHELLEQLRRLLGVTHR